LILADANLRQIEAGCEQWVDPYGQILDRLRDSDRVFDSVPDVPRLAAYQAEVRSQLRHSDAALTYRKLKLQYWDRRTTRLFRNRFRPHRREGEIVFWVEQQARDVEQPAG
jgi:hypothetical protein